MPRPPVIVVPGPMGMGGKRQQVDANIDLGGIIGLIEYFKTKKAQEQAGMATAEQLGIGNLPALGQLGATGGGPEGSAAQDLSGIVNLPQHTQDYSPDDYAQGLRKQFAGSPYGRERLADMWQTQYPGKMTLGNLAALYQMQGNTQGAYDTAALLRAGQQPKGPQALTPFINPKGETIMIDTRDPNSQTIISEQNLKPVPMASAEIRTAAFGTIPTNTPGVYFDRVKKKYLENVVGPDGETTQREIPSPMVQQKNLDYTGKKRLITTANSPQFRRLVNNAEILTEGVVDPKTGKTGEAELDKIVRLRNEVDDGAIASMNNDVRLFNKWDQFLQYQTSDPKLAALKSAVVANAERLGSVYAGGNAATSDKKLEIALELLDYALSREGFASLVQMHKDSIHNTANKFREDAGASKTTPKAKTAPATNKDPLGIR